MVKTKITPDLTKPSGSVKRPNGPHIADRQLLALGGTLAAAASATLPLTPIMKASDLRSRRSDGHARNITRQSRSEEAIRDSESDTAACLKRRRMAFLFWTQIPA
jgi:hypothetical protein